jgi:ubiquinone/menaquinone biosynthesis C-methylase UbiE
MAITKPFDEHIEQYEKWFEINSFAYESELRAVKALLPRKKNGMEIGVGSGRFAAPLEIRLGVEPSAKMRKAAQRRGVDAIDGVAEDLPFDDSRFDFVLMVTTICFLDDVEAGIREAYRVIKNGGCLIIGFVDKTSALGQLYLEHKNESVFYGPATFYSTAEVVGFLEKAGFGRFSFAQTIFRSLAEVRTVEPVRKGYGSGSFVVVKAVKLHVSPKPGRSRADKRRLLKNDAPLSRSNDERTAQVLPNENILIIIGAGK